MKSICAYIRVSTDEQTELSPTSQKKLIQEYCQKNGYILADVYEDLGISGKTVDKRPAFRQMIAMCKTKEHPYDAIVVWKFSRFARNQEETIVYKSMLRKIGIDVISISEPISEGLGGKLTEAILEIMDEYYSINLAQEVMRGMTEGAKQGRIMSTAPYGYSIVNKQLVPNDNAELVRYIFALYVEGHSLNYIASHINSLGYRTRNGRLWENRSIKYILQHPVYIGKMRWNYVTHGGKEARTRKNAPEDWIIVDGTHEPLIDVDTFQQAQDRLAQHQPLPRKAPSKHWLSGVLKCAKCGNGMAYHCSDEKRKTAPYFVCQGKVRGRCNGPSTKAETVVNAFLEGLSMAVETGSYVAVESSANIDDMAELKSQLVQLDKKMVRIKEAYINGVDTIDEYKANKALIDNERANLLSRLEKRENEPQTRSQIDVKQQITSVIDVLKSEDYSVQIKADALRSVMEKCVYSKEDDTMDFYFFS